MPRAMSGISVKERNVAARKAGLKVLRQGNLHYGQVAAKLEEMRALQESYSSLSRDEQIAARDEFAMLSNIVDKHWRIVEKLLPKNIEPTDNDSTEAGTVPNVSAVLERLLPPGAESSTATHGEDGPVVPAEVRAET